MPPDDPNPPRQRQDRVALLARRLAELRHEAGMSQGALGALVGSSQATVSRWEDPGSPSVPSALEAADIAAHFGVDPAWLVGTREYRAALPAGESVLDQALLDEFAAAETSDQLERLLDREMTFGTLWVQIPAGASVVPVHEALRRVKEVDRRVRQAHPHLWQRWAELVLR